MLLLPGRLNQKLEEKSYLTIEFLGDRSYNRKIPFYENISIVESKKANYIQYKPMGRSSPLLSYFGSDARMFDVGFTINLQHVYDTFSTNPIILTFPGDTNAANISRDSFFKYVVSKNSGVKYKNQSFNARTYAVDYLSEIKGITNETAGIIAANAFASLNITQKAIVDIIVYWINLIRSTVVNNSETVKDGPPIVRINSGILYQDIPCVCTSYSIDKDEVAGYDNATLLPRLIKVSMNLMEIRHGDFTKFEASKPIKRDNIVGWETVVTQSGSTSFNPMPLTYSLLAGSK